MNEAESKEAEPQYPREIEKVLVTSGENIGRVKDHDFAHDMANEQAFEQKMLSHPDRIASDNNARIKGKIAREALAESTLADKIAYSTTWPDFTQPGTDVEKVRLYDEAHTDATKSAERADEFLKVSKPANDVQELARAKEQLAAARNKINELEAGKK